MARCARCEKTLIGEIQKGNKYYRCQTKGCSQKTVREELLDAAIRETLNGLKFNEVENQYFRQQIKQAFQNITELSAAQTQTFSMQLEQTRERLSKLADAYIDGNGRKRNVLNEKE